jgi:hypothetical protein
MINATPSTTGTYDTRKAAATRRRRHANGQYVTAAQREAFAKTMQRDGRKTLTQAECEALASHPHLTVGQRAEYAKMSIDWSNS